MKTLVRIALSLVLLTLIGGASLAGGPPDPRPPVDLPEQAVEVAPGLYYLGTEVHKDKLVEGYAFVHYRAESAKPASKPAKPGASRCYEYMWRNTKWFSAEPFYVQNTTAGTNASTVASIMNGAVGRWEDAASADIIANGTAGNGAAGDPGVYNERNEVAFAPLGSSMEGAIAVTYVWKTRVGTQLLEWDQIYNTSSEYCWSFSANPNWSGCTGYRNDFDNIATHELGHSMGMSDLYTNSCTAETMYGYASDSETSKRDLNAGDILGISTLY